MNEIIPNPPAIVRAAVDVKGATAEICEDYENYLQCGGEAVAYARRMGANLIDIKRSLPHGQWLPYVKQNLPFSVNSAATFMRVASHWEEVAANRDRAKSLRGAITLLAEPGKDNEVPQTECLGNSQRAVNLSSELDSGQSGESGEQESAAAEPDAPAATPPPPPEPTANGTSGPKKNHPRCARCKRTGKVELCATCKAIAAALKAGPLCKRCLGDGPREDCPDCADLRGVQAEPETPRDALGLVVPDDKLPHFAAREKFQEVASRVRQLQKLLAEIAGAPGGEYLLGYMTLTEKAGRQAMHHDKLKALAHEIARQAPYSVLCPYCHAKAPGHPPAPECTACRGRPFVTEPIARGAPKDYLEAVKEMAR